jgi:hypothetical protein
MRYEPVKIVTLVERKFDAGTGVFVSEGPEYFQVQGKTVGTCGHKHTTREEAEPCRVALYSQWRIQKATRKRATLATKTTTSTTTTTPTVTPTV